jgi:hypothetical protein
MSCEPQTYDEAIRDPAWAEAIKEEKESLIKNHTWTQTELPSGKTPISTRWLFRVKQKADGTLHKRKARLVARGFEQIQGLDYEETFTLVVKWATIRMLVALAAQQGWRLYHMDIKTAFLNGDLEQEVYISTPRGFETPGQEHLVCKLLKALYGLKQALLAWYQKINCYLKDQGFVKGEGDHNLYVLWKLGKIIVLALYVDDLLFSGNCIYWINFFKTQLESKFEMSELNEGDVIFYLRAESIQVPGGIFLTQRGYAKKLLETFGMQEYSPVSTPMVEKLKLQTDMRQPQVDPTNYRSIVDSLIQLGHTRFDIAFSVGIVSRFMAWPQVPHLQAAQRILRYIKGTSQFGILYKRNTNSQVYGYVDSDFVGDTEGSRSTIGSTFCLGESPITWILKRQSCVALSSTEAEYMAMSSAAQESTWLNMLSRDFGIQVPWPIPLYCDNEAAMKMANNPQITPRNKHIGAHYHYTRDKITQGDLRLHYIFTMEQAPELFTKPLGRQLFEKFR